MVLGFEFGGETTSSEQQRTIQEFDTLLGFERLDPQLQARGSELFNVAVNRAGEGAQGQDIAPRGVAPVNPELQSLTNTSLGLAGTGFDPNDPLTQALIASATRPITEDLERKTLPSLRDAAARAGTSFGSRFGLGEALARGGASRGKADVTAQLLASLRSADLNRQLEALGISGDFAELLQGIQQREAEAPFEAATLNREFGLRDRAAGQTDIQTAANVLATLLQGPEAQLATTDVRGSETTFGGAVGLSLGGGR